MSITENESTTIRDCLKQLKECAEFLIKSTEDVENEMKDFSITPTPASVDKKDHTKEYDKLRKTLKKIYKEAKQKIHSAGKTIKDPDDNNLDASSIAEEDPSDEQIVNDPLLTEMNAAKVEVPETNGDDQTGHSTPKQNGIDPPEFLPANPSEENKPPNEECKTKIRLVAIEKLLDPKVMASSSSLIPNALEKPRIQVGSSMLNTNMNMSSSIIILDSDDEVPEPASTKVVSNGALEKSKDKRPSRSVPKVKPVKVRISKCRVSEKLLKAGKRKIKVSLQIGIILGVTKANI